MTTILLGKPIVDFNFTTTRHTDCQFSDLKGQHVVLYFYPKDNTPGCTNEGLDFNENLANFNRLNTVVFGISRDSIKSHEKFIAKFQFKFDLISDPDEKICQLFDVIKEKNMYGRKVMGIERSTFLIDSQGILRQQWRKVKVPGHVEEVLLATQALKK
mgnify:CR=1 FL=1